MTLAEKFEDAQAQVKTLPQAPDAGTLLDLYGLYKQATAGDLTGKRPGFIDIKGRAKYDAWEAKKGLTQEAAMRAYCDLVGRLVPTK